MTKKNDCFRVYDTPEESFTDHSLFLRNGRRYQFLFELDKKDYKQWAKGLKQAGYATNPQYADLLINIIETYELHKIQDKTFYLTENTVVIAEDENNGNKHKHSDINSSNEKVDKAKKTSLAEKLFGKTKWWQRRHETPEQRKRRLLDEKIQKMTDKQDVQRTDFEIEFE